MKRSTALALLALLALRVLAAEAASASDGIGGVSSGRCTTPSGGVIPPSGGSPSARSSSASTNARRRCASNDYLYSDLDVSSGPSVARSAALTLRGGHSSSPSFSIGASLASFAKSNPATTAFISCALNGLAADWIAQRSEAAGRRSAARREAATDAVIRNIRPSGAAFVGNPNNMTHDHNNANDHESLGGTSGTEAVNRALSEQTPSSAASNAFRWDARRSLAFVLYGGCYQGMACHAFYNVLFLKWFGPDRVWTKVAVSQFIMAPLLTLPCAYLFKGMVFGKTASQTLADYWTGVTTGGLLLSFWKLWIPVQFLIFKVIPVHLRIPFSSFFSFLWTVVLSRMTNRA